MSIRKTALISCVAAGLVLASAQIFAYGSGYTKYDSGNVKTFTITNKSSTALKYSFAPGVCPSTFHKMQLKMAHWKMVSPGDGWKYSLTKNGTACFTVYKQLEGSKLSKVEFFEVHNTNGKITFTHKEFSKAGSAFEITSMPEKNALEYEVH